MAELAKRVQNEDPSISVRLNTENVTCIHIEFTREGQHTAKAYVNRVDGVARWSLYIAGDEDLHTDDLTDALAFVVAARTPIEPNDDVEPDFPPDLAFLSTPARRCCCVGSDEEREVFLATLDSQDLEAFEAILSKVCEPSTNEELESWFDATEHTGGTLLLLTVLDELVRRGLVQPPENYKPLVEFDDSEFDEYGNEW